MSCGPAYGWDRRHLEEMSIACIIVHNMIVEDGREHAGNMDFTDIGVPSSLRTAITEVRSEWINGHHNITDRECFNQLQHNLIEYLWARRGAMGRLPKCQCVFVFIQVDVFLV